MALGTDVVALVVVMAVVSAATDGTAVTAETVGVAVADDDATGAVEADVARAATVVSAVSAAVATGALGRQQLVGDAATNSLPDDPRSATVSHIADLHAATTASPPRPKFGRLTAGPHSAHQNQQRSSQKQEAGSLAALVSSHDPQPNP